MKQNIVKLLMSFSLLLLGTQAQALLITANDCSALGGSITCTTGTETSEAAIRDAITAMYGLDQLYKQNVGDPGDTGDFASSYVTEFLLEPNDPSRATITYVPGEEAITCPECLLLVKDGNQDPAWFLFNIGDIWDGIETIGLDYFWIDDPRTDVIEPHQGSISHISIYGSGTPTDAPEPQILALLGIGLIGVFLTRRKVK